MVESWFKNLNVGDIVIEATEYGENLQFVKEKAGDTILLDNEHIFSSPTIHSPTEFDINFFLKKFTKEKSKEMKREMIEKFSNLDWSKINIVKLKLIKDIIDDLDWYNKR